MSNSTLHIVRQSPFSHLETDLCIQNIKDDDAVVFIDDGCYVLNHQVLSEYNLKASAVYVLADHLLARGLKESNEVASINLTVLNQLIFSHQNSVTW